jgi:hypothetical protein
VPPDVTVGVEELEVGAELPELPVLPVLPESPEVPELPLEEDPPVAAPVPAVDRDLVDVPLRTALAPGCSCATTMPMAAVAPAAASTAARVRCRTRVWTRSRLPGVLGGIRGDMSVENLCFGTTPSHHARLDIVAGPAVGLL